MFKSLLVGCFPLIFAVLQKIEQLTFSKKPMINGNLFRVGNRKSLILLGKNRILWFDLSSINEYITYDIEMTLF